ncbi:MAG TPA: serine/threonine-protein kinase [Anaerolineaceae bacterium]|nr:serine/threonine-protein kinase [Anaerolineaceae bacterium]
MMQVFKRGTQIGPYIILEPVPGGIGGMATVYKAQLGRNGPIVALKVAHEGMGDFLKDEGAFLRARQLSHPNIVRILPTPLLDGSHEYIVKDAATGCWYFAMEYLAGGNLDQWMQARKRLTLPEALDIITQVGQALDVAHQAGVLHLDVKPSNILFRSDPRHDGQYPEAVLTDFGIARPEGRIASGQTLTIEYASPEQARRVQGEPLVVGKAADLYSLAVIFYEMLTGKLPFQAHNDTALLHHIVYESPNWNIQIPPGLVPVLQRALAKEPEERYASARDFVLAVREQIPPEALQVTNSSSIETTANHRLSPLLILALGVVIGLGIGMPGGYYLGLEHSGEMALVVSPTASVMLTEPTATLGTKIEMGGTEAMEFTPTSPPQVFTPTREPTSTPKPTHTPTPTPRPVTATPTGTPVAPSPLYQ